MDVEETIGNFFVCESKFAYCNATLGVNIDIRGIASVQAYKIKKAGDVFTHSVFRSDW